MIKLLLNVPITHDNISSESDTAQRSVLHYHTVTVVASSRPMNAAEAYQYHVDLP